MTYLLLCWRGSVLRAALVVFCLFSAVLCGNLIFGQAAWTAPPAADNYKNPYTGNSTATAAGEILYQQLCVICHGQKGKGDGIAGMNLKPRPANFTKETFQAQTDGSIYWKMTEGKAPMATYKEVLTEQQRWQLVNYIRQLGKK